MIEIKSIYGSLLLTSELGSVRLALEEGVIKDANLRDANLRGANLRGANLRGANLRGADLRGANLQDANLRGADLRGANLRGANLQDANLQGANFQGANLRDANLQDANLQGANLRDANLANTKGADLAITRTRILPEGALIGWKKCSGGLIVKLRIPEEAQRSHAFGRKCRAEFVDVLEVIGGETAFTDNHGPETVYKAGKRVFPDSWDSNWQNECANGIHFFITRAEAEAYS